MTGASLASQAASSAALGGRHNRFKWALDSEVQQRPAPRGLLPPLRWLPLADPPSPLHLTSLQVADETKAEFAKGLAEAMKRKMAKTDNRSDWEQRLEAAAMGRAAEKVSSTAARRGCCLHALLPSWVVHACGALGHPLLPPAC